MSATGSIVEDGIVEIEIADERKSTLAEKEEAIPAAANGQIHPGLPTFAQTAADPNIAYSDHLPVLAQVPLTEQGIDGPSLNLLSLNTLGHNLFSGIHQDFYFAESADAIKARYTRIAEFLRLSIEQNNLDCILLQETELDIMLPILKQMLGDDWHIEISDKRPKVGNKENNGLITCYNTTKLKACTQPSFNNDQRVLSQSFQHQCGKTIHLHNSWGNFSQNPRVREAEYRPLLTAHVGDKNALSIVMGDTNSRVVPLHDKPQNTATTSIPPKILKDHDPKYSEENLLHVADNSDGGYYTDFKGHIRQMDTKICNFATGQPFDDAELAISDEELQNPGYRANEYRLAMCLDHSYTTQERIAGKTLAEYEVELQERAQDPAIQVSMAANSRNEKALAIWCLGRTSEFYRSLKTLPGVENAFFEVAPQSISVIFIPRQYIPDLIAAAESYLQPEPSCDVESQLTEIGTEISRLEKSPGSTLFNRSPHDKIARLGELRAQLTTNDPMTKYDVRSTIRRWENQEHTVRRGGVDEIKTSGEILGEHRSKLRGVFLDKKEPTVTSSFLTGFKKGPR